MHVLQASPRGRSLRIAVVLMVLPSGALLAWNLDGAERHRLADVLHVLALGAACQPVAEPAPVLDSFALTRTH